MESISEIYLDEVTRTVKKSVLQCYDDMFEIKMAKLGDDAGAMGSKDEQSPSATPKDGGKGGGAVESKTLDGGTRVFRFGEVEVEGRLKSPQIVYFLRRVRAEFAAGDLGHRSFMGELKETRNEPGF